METNEKTNGYAKKLIELLAGKMDIELSKYNMDELIQGMLVELEHGSKNEKTDVTGDDPSQTLKLVLAHMDELPDYYTRLKKMESEADSVKTDNVEEKEAEEDEDDDEDNEDKKQDKKSLTENTAKRFKELCGIMENKEKKQLNNQLFQEGKKNFLLKEEIDPAKFDIAKFSNDGLGEKISDEEIDLYKMQKKEKNN